jgi:tetratricopeptide (TPR) repeat protein
MRWVALGIALAIAADLCLAGRGYELNGRIIPESHASVALFGATTPFHTDTLADSRGHFRIRGLEAGEYTVAVFIPGRGEARRTVEIGPSTADRKGRVGITINVEDSRALSPEALRGTETVSTRELAIPESARHEYAEAQKDLARRDTTAAIDHLEKAVEIAPQLAAAWNNLGTIAYQSRDFAHAESYFRKSLDQDPGSFEPLVNLGGVLLTVGKLDEALKYNQYAVLRRPNDALANAQLGMSYFALGNLDVAVKYLETAKRIDPAHFSYPQLTLAEIHLRRNERAAAAEEFRDFLKRHPDAPVAASIRAALEKLAR